MATKKESEKLKEKLFYSKKSFFETADAETRSKALAFAEGYKKFIDSSKTEREAVMSAVELAKKKGFKEYRIGDSLVKGGKYYCNNRGKSVILFRLSKSGKNETTKILASHIDSPRLDFKPVPVYEDTGICYFKTHYYGGIKKYQWSTIPLALHGVVSLRGGKTVDICIGESENDPVFYISDLLPHLAADQMSRKATDILSGEQLNVICGSEPLYDGSEKDEIKLNVLKCLNDKYGITEKDFISAEISAVPALKARDVGFDRWLLASYGHDDRVCAYPALMSVLESSGDANVFCVLADKEETGSDGNTGMQSDIFADIIAELAKFYGKPYGAFKAGCSCLSADVTAAFDPNFPEVFEKNNSSIASCGVSLAKYTGSRGKYSTNDASAEFLGSVIKALDAKSVLWQISELGKIDVGGGGTVAKYISKLNIDTLDIGVPVISMHSPFEVISKSDLYTAYLAFGAFLGA